MRETFNLDVSEDLLSYLHGNHGKFTSMGTARDIKSVTKGTSFNLGWVLLRSARAQGTSTFAQSNGPHCDSVMKRLDEIRAIEHAALKLNIF